jgi:hypothetical protein
VPLRTYARAHSNAPVNENDLYKARTGTLTVALLRIGGALTLGAWLVVGWIGTGGGAHLANFWTCVLVTLLFFGGCALLGCAADRP